ncbi:hypothetical protein [Labrenzia sp. DG1229]|uniref:hypothetical protein n=1 Tax=Labrenzia sp. DG1229 TaxID=681847 RepID=UPI00048EA1D4|nr:hypothetical protein [Labrenzia sp. DG1229]
MEREFAITIDESAVVSRIDYSVTAATLSGPDEFDAAENLESVLESVLTNTPEPQYLQYAAAQAIQRLTSRADESPEAWAEDAAKVFFADLEVEDR